MNTTSFFRFILIVASILILSACGSSSPNSVAAKSANAHLDNLVLSDGALDQPISRDVTAYSAAVANDVSSITLRGGVFVLATMHRHLNEAEAESGSDTSNLPDSASFHPGFELTKMQVTSSKPQKKTTFGNALVCSLSCKTVTEST